MAGGAYWRHRIGSIASNPNGVSALTFGTVEAKGRIDSAHVVFDATLTVGAQAQTVTIDIWRNGTKLCTAASLSLAASTVYAPAQRYEFTLSSTYPNTFVAPGDVIVVNYTQGSSGLALPACFLHVDDGAITGLT